jgi:hypothetical protein
LCIVEHIACHIPESVAGYAGRGRQARCQQGSKRSKGSDARLGYNGSHGIQEILYLESSPKRKDAERIKKRPYPHG